MINPKVNNPNDELVVLHLPRRASGLSNMPNQGSGEVDDRLHKNKVLFEHEIGCCHHQIPKVSVTNSYWLVLQQRNWEGVVRLSPKAYANAHFSWLFTRYPQESKIPNRLPEGQAKLLIDTLCLCSIPLSNPALLAKREFMQSFYKKREDRPMMK